MALWVPEAAREDAERAAQVDHQLWLAKEFRRHLQDLDPELDLVFAKEGATELVPGRWHIVRHNQGAPDTYMAITGPRGEYREPDDQVLAELRRRDLWTDDGIRRAKEEDERRAAAWRKAAEDADEQRREEFADRVASTTRTQVRF